MQYQIIHSWIYSCLVLVFARFGMFSYFLTCIVLQFSHSSWNWKQKGFYAWGEGSHLLSNHILLHLSSKTARPSDVLLIMFGIMNTLIGGVSASTPGQSQSQPQKDQCDMFINVVYSGDKGKSASQNPNHERFLKKRKFLERKGLLRSKSEPYVPPYKHRRNKSNAGQSNSTVSSTEGSHSQRPKVVFRNDATRPQPAKVKANVESGVCCPVSGGSSKRNDKRKRKAKQLNPVVAGPASAQEPPVPGSVSDANRRAISLLDGLNIPALAPALINPSKYAAIDCEMVGGGTNGQVNMLARCSVVSYEGDVIFDEYIKPDHPVTCYRTRWSGIRPSNLVNAMPFQEAKKQVTWEYKYSFIILTSIIVWLLKGWYYGIRCECD